LLGDMWIEWNKMNLTTNYQGCPSHHLLVRCYNKESQMDIGWHCQGYKVKLYRLGLMPCPKFQLHLNESLRIKFFQKMLLIQIQSILQSFQHSRFRFGILHLSNKIVFVHHYQSHNTNDSIQQAILLYLATVYLHQHYQGKNMYLYCLQHQQGHLLPLNSKLNLTLNC